MYNGYQDIDKDVSVHIFVVRINFHIIIISYGGKCIYGKHFTFVLTWERKVFKFYHSNQNFVGYF